MSVHTDRSDWHSVVWRISLSVLVVEAPFGQSAHEQLMEMVAGPTSVFVGSRGLHLDAPRYSTSKNSVSFQLSLVISAVGAVSRFQLCAMFCVFARKK